MKKTLFFISAAAVLLVGCAKEQLVEERSYTGPVTVVGATFESLTEDGTTKAAVTDAGVFTWQNGDKAAFAESSASTSYCFGTNSADGTTASFAIDGEHTFTASSWAIYPDDLTTDQVPTNLKVNVPASRVWVNEQTNVAMYGKYETASKSFSFSHMGGLVRVRVKNVPTNAREFVFKASGCKINGEFSVNTVSESKVIETVASDNEDEQTYTLTWTTAPAAENTMDFYIPLPFGTYSGGFAFYLKDEGHNVLYSKVGSTPQTIARKKLLLMPAITLVGGSIEPVEKAAIVANIPAGYSGDYLLPQSEKVILKINASTSDHDITLKYDGANIPTNLEVKVVDGDNAGNYNAKLLGTLPSTHVEFRQGHIDATELTTSSSTFAVINPASVGTLTVKGGNVKVEGASVTSIVVAENAVASEETKAPVQIVVEKSDAQEFTAPAVTAKANVVVAPAEDVTVKVTAEGEAKVANGGAGTVKDKDNNDIDTKAAAKIGTAKYITLADAVAAVKNNEQIDIIAEEISATVIPEGNKTFTIDLGNNEVTVVGPAVGSSQTMNQAFQILKGNTVTIQNGTINCDNTNNIFRFVIQNYSNLTLNNVTVDGTNLKKNDRTDAYTVSSNFSTITFAGNTTVKASTVSGVDAYAIDLYDYTKHGYTQSAAGVWDSDGSIIGAITLGGGSLTVSKELKLTKPMKAYKGDNGIVNLTVNANIIPGDNYDGDALVIVNRGGDLTISGSGKVSNNNNAGIYCAVKMTEASDVVSDSETNRAKLTVDESVTLEGYQAGISGNGNDGRGHTDVTISGSVLVKGCATDKDECCGIYQPQNGTLTINGGTIEGLVGVYVKSGSVTTAVNGGTIKGTGAKNDYVANGGGFKETGDAIVFDNCDYPGGAPNATINGGTFISTNGQAVASYAKTGLDPISPVINGGTFSDLSGVNYVADNATYTLGADVDNAKGMIIDTKKTFTVDFGGHTYTVNKPGAGSINTQTSAFQLLKDQTITFKNGTIRCHENNKSLTWETGKSDVEKGIAMIIQDYAKLTLEKMTIDGTNIAHNGNNVRYMVSSNYGDINFTGKTSIIAPAGDFAFDAYDNTSDSYPNAPTVTVNTTGTITGGVEVTGGNLVVNKGNFTNKGTTIWAKSGNVTIDGGSFASTGNCAVGVTGNAKVTLNNGTFNSQESTVLFDGAGATIDINGGTYTAIDNAVIAGNGKDRTGDANTVTISGGTFTGGITTGGYIACGIYAPWKDNITVNGGTFNITDGAGVVARAGVVTIDGGTFKCTGTATGKVGDKAVNLPCECLIFDDSDPAYPAKTADSKIVVKKGTFSDESAIKYAAKDAEINIALQADRNASGIFLGENKNVKVTFDLGGKTLNFKAPAVGSSGTENQAFHIEQGNQLFTLRNGRVTIDENAKTAFRFIIQNYNNLTVDGVELDGTNLAYNVNDKVRYTVSNNQGTVNFTGNTIIKAAAENGIAFDVCKNGSYTAPTVTWASSGSVTGNIELAGGKLVIASDLGYANTIMATEGTSNLEVNATLSATNASDWYLVKAGSNGKSGVVLNITGTGTLSSGTSEHCIPVTSDYGAQVNISGGNYKCYGVNTNTPDGGECVYANREGKVSISGGTFGVREGDTVKDLLNVQNNQEVTDIQCTAGTFYGKNPADGDDAKGGSFVAEGYEAKETSTGVWTVSAKQN